MCLERCRPASLSWSVQTRALRRPAVSKEKPEQKLARRRLLARWQAPRTPRRHELVPRKLHLVADDEHPQAASGNDTRLCCSAPRMTRVVRMPGAEAGHGQAAYQLAGGGQSRVLEPWRAQADLFLVERWPSYLAHLAGKRGPPAAGARAPASGRSKILCNPWAAKLRGLELRSRRAFQRAIKLRVRYSGASNVTSPTRACGRVTPAGADQNPQYKIQYNT
jgi:hypothetical protein